MDKVGRHALIRELAAELEPLDDDELRREVFEPPVFEHNPAAFVRVAVAASLLANRLEDRGQ